jgi:hypothetical protein
VTVNTLRVSDTTTAIVARLRGDARLDGVAVSRASEVNERPSGCPWVGVYRVEQRFTPRTVGAGSGFMTHNIDFVIILQAAGGNSGEDCEDMLEQLVSNVVSTLLEDTSLGGTVLMVNNLTVRYQDYSRVDDVYMQTAALYLTAETRVSVS